MDNSRENNLKQPDETSADPSRARDQVKDAAKDVVQDAKAQGQELAKETVTQAKQSLSQVRDQTLAALSQAQSQVADHGNSLAKSFTKTSESLRDDDEGELAELAERVSAQVQHAADYLRGKDISSLLQDTATLARRRPELVLGGAVLIGMLGGRFLKSSGKTRR